MRLGLIAALAALTLFALPGCSQPSPTPQATAQPAVPTPTATTAAPVQASTPTPTAVPTPTPPPTPTLFPTVTPTPPPTPTTRPTPTTPPTRSESGTPAPKELSLKIEPEEPYSGRDAFFTLEGLDPWEEVTVQFVDPDGQPAEWVTEYESYLTDANDNPVTERRLYADAQGQATWQRIGTRDQAGVWTVRVIRENLTTALTYPVIQLPLTPIGSKTLGIDFRLYQGPVSNTYYTGGVPGAIAVDLQEHLRLVTDGLRGLSGLQGDQTPTIYLVDNLDLLKQVSESSGSTLGFADGYYRSAGEDSGVYMHTDSLLTGIQRLLTHEYVHLVLSEAIGPVDLPSWLNEGTATYYEYLLNAAGERANAAKHPLYRSTGVARNAARSGNLLALTNLENQDIWNGQTDKDHIDLQYAQSHMAVRYLSETYGTSTPIDMMKRMGQGATLSEAFSEIAGVEYQTFEQRFALWLKSWQDPERKQIAEYTRSLNQIMEGRTSIGDRWSENLASTDLAAERVAANRILVADAEGLLTRIGELSPPRELQPLQDDAARFLERFVNFLSLELGHLRDQEYLVFLSDIIGSVDSISKTRVTEFQSSASAAQRVITLRALVSDSESLVQRLLDAPAPPSLNSLQLQELDFLETYLQVLTIESDHFLDQEYLEFLAEIVRSVDSISGDRATDIRSGTSAAQRVITKRGFVADAESLVQELIDTAPPSNLEPFRTQGLAFLDKYVQFLTLELEQQREEVYLQLLADIGSEANDITTRRSKALQSGGSSSQRITTSEGLVSDAALLLSKMGAVISPSRLHALQLQGTTYLNKYIRWLTLELEFAETNDIAKLDQANAMIAEINSLGNGFRSELVKEQRAQPNQNEANSMLGEIADGENLLIEAINTRNSATLQKANDKLGEYVEKRSILIEAIDTEFENSASLRQADALLEEIIARENTVSQGISDLEFIYNLREP